MIIRFKTLLLILSFCNILSAQKDNKEIYWIKKRKLTWDDYKGVPETGFLEAVSYCGFQYKPSYKNDTLIFVIETVLSKEKSWVKKEHNKNQDLLIHEQSHFDLTELYARKIRKALIECKLNGDKVKAFAEAETMFRILNDELNNVDAQYDKETNFSLNKVKQAEWTKKINDEITALDKYSNTQIKRVLGSVSENKKK